jgi:polyhydroxyalkanoate synthase
VQGDAEDQGAHPVRGAAVDGRRAPSNFLALNPEAQKKAIDTKGESIAKGMQNLLHDLRQGHVSHDRRERVRGGPQRGHHRRRVVFENELFQLIEYKPLTAKVHERPLLLVPPCINKFYILDLQPDNSLIRYAVEQGHRTFVVSWRNPDESLAHKTWDDYIEHAAIRPSARCRRSPAPRDQRAGLLRRRHHPGHGAGGAGRPRRASRWPALTLLTTLLDFTDTGMLDIFIDEAFVQAARDANGQGRPAQGQELATTFSFLRPNDLVWNYVVGNYLKGETPPPFDLLYWNSDSTNLPGPMYCWYLRHTYLENKLKQARAVTVCGEKVDLAQDQGCPVFIYGSREDHIVPWRRLRVAPSSSRARSASCWAPPATSPA